MCAEHKKDEEAIFNDAIKIKSDTERAAFIKSACGDDAALLARVEALLKIHFEDKSFLKSPPAGINGTLDMLPLTEAPGTKIGRYKLLQLIGEGGFGVVYMAEQQEPIRRKVALKIIKLGMDTKQVIARFEAERQALAMMDHPNIARVFDAGATDTGRPYFVMELVKGIPITEYCDKNNLDTQQRLELFIEVCKAVQHAHQKGIIHRDIKPSNVMITLHDSKPVPKIIDFGIAKATQQRLTEKTLFTEYRQFIGTPEYMSPEQAEMSGLDIDTRSDIYSLGVLLYELLTGTTPFEADKLRSAAYDEIRRIIREDEPPKPSTRLNTLGDALTDIAKRRDVQPGELCKIVRGDLDWIVMKALEKNRTRRYEMADGLAADIQRYLQDEPVVAHPPSNFYRFQKRVRKNKLAFAAASAVTVALILGFGVSTWMHRYRSSLAGIETTRREELASARKRLGNDDPNLPNYIITLVNVLKANGKTDEARVLAEEAVELFRRHPGWPARGREESLSTLNEILKNLWDYSAAISAQAERLQSLRARLPADDPALRDALADSLGEYIWTLLFSGQFAEAEAPAREVLPILEKKHDEVGKFWVQSMLGESLWRQKRYAEAEPLLLSAYEGANAHKDEIPDGWSGLFLGETIWRLKDFYVATGRPEEAAKWRNKVVEFERAEAARKAVKTDSSLAGIETIRREELASARKRLGNNDPNLPNYIITLVNVLKTNGKPDEACLLAEEAVELFRRHPDWPVRKREESLSTLNGILTNLGDWAASASAQAERLRSLRARLPADDPALRDALGDWLGEYTWTLLISGQFAEAEAPAREVLPILEKNHDEVGKFWVQSMLGESLWRQKRYAEAEPLLLSACEGANAHKDEIPNGWRDLFLGEPLRRMVSFYEVTGRPEEAAKWRNECAEFERAEAAKKAVKP